jgi:hypothetical protein
MTSMRAAAKTVRTRLTSKSVDTVLRALNRLLVSRGLKVTRRPLVPRSRDDVFELESNATVAPR